VGIKNPRNADQLLCKIGVHAPVAPLVGIGQSGAGDGASDAHVIQAAGRGPQAGFNIPQALAEAQLRKSHAQKLIPTGKTPQPVVGFIARYTTPELVHRRVIHQLRKHQAAFVHRPQLCRQS
jgi:hypothetical protein